MFFRENQRFLSWHHLIFGLNWKPSQAGTLRDPLDQGAAEKVGDTQRFFPPLSGWGDHETMGILKIPMGFLRLSSTGGYIYGGRCWDDWLNRWVGHGWPRTGGRGSKFWSEMGKPNMKVERLPSFLAMFLMFIDYQTSPECIEETTEKPRKFRWII